MKQSMSGGGGVVTTARLNGGGGATGVTIVYQPQRPSGGAASANHHNHTQQRLQQHQQVNGGSQQQVTFRRFANNMVQVRRVITQQPQQFHQLADLSSSESSGLEATPLAVTKRNNTPTVPTNQGHQRILRRIQRTAAGGKDGEDGLDEDDSFADLDVSLVRGDGGADDDDEEELLIDHDEDGDDDGEVAEADGDGRMGVEKSAMELNGNGVDSQYLRHVIETQILNRHKTRIKDWDGTKGHMCQSCHETFLSESGLEMHRNRRILHILFFCRYCKRDLSFFNKCRLLQHLRNHRVTPTVSSLQNCIMIRLLPESEYLHFEYEDCTSSSDEEEDGSGGGLSGGGGSGATPPKRLKPNRFRRSKQSESGNNDKDSPDNSPVIARKTPTVSPITPSSTNPTNISNVPPLTTSNNSAITSSKFQPRNEQVTVIKSTGNTPSIGLPSTTPGSVTMEKKVSTPLASPNAPQIRIRNLSQITVSVNEDDTQEEAYDKEQGELKMEPVTTTKMLRPQMVKVPAPTTSSGNGRMESASSPRSQGVQKMEYRCYKCDKDFESASQFFSHLEDAEQVGLSSRSLHRCPTDDIPSWSQCQYVFHTKVFHEKSVPFLCPGCGDESPDYSVLMEHVTNDCFYLSQRARYMCASASLHKCSFADRKSVKTEPEIVDHLKKEHSRAVLQCLHCTQGFATENWLLKHLSESHNIHLDESKGDSEREALINKTTRPLTQCLICNILFPNGSTYLQHVYLNFHVHILYVKMLECQSCFSIFETNEEIMNHRRESDKCRKLDPFRMKICTAELDSSSGTRMGEQMGMSPTPIKIIANPAAMITNSQSQQPTPPPIKHIVKQEPQTSSSVSHSQGASAVVTVISSSGNRGSPSSQQQQQRSQFQHQQQHQQAHHEKQVTTSFQQKNTQKSSQISSESCANANNASKSHGNANSKKGFDDLLSCQFCERLVVFSSLRKHEDQCSGLSTVAPGFCLTCRLNFGSKKLLARHGLVHIRDGLPICLFCNNRLIRPTHPKSSTPTPLESSYALKKHIYSNHTSKAVKFPHQCMLCDQFCRDKRATEFHIKEHQFRIPNNTPDPDPTPLPTSPEDLCRLLKVRRKATDPRRKAGKVIQVYYCPLCKNREFANCNGLARHLTLVHQKDPTSLNMSLLKKASTARRFVVKAPNSQGVGAGSRTGGVDSRTVINNVSSTTSKQPSSSSISQAIPVKSSTATSTPTPSRFTSTITLRKRIGSTTVITRSKPVAAPQRQAPVTRQRSSTTSSTGARPSPQTRSSSAATAPSSSPSSRARRKDGTFNCLKCPEFSCKTEKDFCEHIKWKHVWPEHEIQKLQYGNKAGLEEPSEYWCPECDTVFVAKPSLVRHLKFAHDYINSEDYMQKIGYDGKKPLKPNQCEVCYYQCADDRELQQHIRNHGMAFLRLRQQRQQQSANNNANK